MSSVHSLDVKSLSVCGIQVRCSAGSSRMSSLQINLEVM